jgi:sulfur carrier protein
MNIRCNDQEVQIEATTLANALLELGYHDAVVATAVNGEFVPRTMRETTPLVAGDLVDIVAPQQGG